MKDYTCKSAHQCGGYEANVCENCGVANPQVVGKKPTPSGHDIVMALAMNRDPATLIVGNARMKVLIENVDSKVMPGCEDDTKISCRVVSEPSRPTFADRFTPAERAYFKRVIAADAAAVDQAIIRNKAPAGMHGGFTLPRNGEFAIDRVIFNDPATIVYWKDGTKTVVKCQEGDTYSAETGLALCFAKKALGNKGNFNDVFKKWVPEEKVEETPVEEAVEG